MSKHLSYPFSQPPALGAMTEVAAGVWWLRMPLPFALDHINLWLLRDGAGWCVVDTGYDLPEVRAAWQQVLASLDGPVTRIVVTHFHPDHLGLAAWLQELSGAPLLMSAGEYLTAQAVWHEIGGHGLAPMLEQFRQHGLDEPRRQALAARGSAYRRGVQQLPVGYRRLRDGQALEIGGNRWQVVNGFGHSPEHLALYCTERHMLISGDMLLPKISTNISVFAVTPMDDALHDYLQSLVRYADEIAVDTLVLPSHGLPFCGVQSRVAALQAHHAERLALLEANCGQPQSTASLLATLFPRALDTHQTMFAMGEAIAHLNHLEKAGRLSRSCDADGVFHFQRVTPTN